MQRDNWSQSGLFLPLLLVATLLSGCVVTDHAPYDATPSGRLTAMNAVFTPPKSFEYRGSSTAHIVAEAAKSHENYQIYSITGPPLSPATADLRIEANLYLSQLEGIDRLVIVLPIWGSADFPQRKIVKSLLDWSGGALHVIEVLGDEPMFRWNELAEAQTEAEFFALAQESALRVADTVKGIRQLVDWVDSYADLEIDVVGFSMGALVGAIAIGLDERLTAGVLMLGGSEPAEILANCSSHKIARVRKSAMRRFDWSRAEYRSVMETYFSAGNPSQFQGRFDPSRLLIIDGALDTCMTRESRDALWQATGRPERYRILSTHRWGFLALTPLALNQASRRIFDFIMTRPTDPSLSKTASAPPLLLAATPSPSAAKENVESNQ